MQQDHTLEDHDTETMDKYKRNLQNLLRKLFQFDSADLDFGIYRIMNQKRDAIENFIEKDLIDAVDVAFEKYSTVNRGEIEKELTEIKSGIESTLGADALDEYGEVTPIYRDSTIAKEYLAKKQELASAEVSAQHKAEIFSHIHNFFSRYYDNGDFMSLRRYSKKNKYVIPYNGEEVLLHWANKDQYYIKTGEHFGNYSFKAAGCRINFTVVQAETDKGNVKSQDKRFFILKEGDDAIEVTEAVGKDSTTEAQRHRDGHTNDSTAEGAERRRDGNERKEETKGKMKEAMRDVTVYFEYRGLTEDEKTTYKKQNTQDHINDENEKKILAALTSASASASPPVPPSLEAALIRKVDEKKEKSLLKRHLIRYTRKNTTDYFIHKNLKGFLENELDFYIKNEVLLLDDIVSGNEPLDKYMTRVKVIRNISTKIIEFLAQIEDFQKKLWEKKKFVLETNYCITLDRVPEELYPEIAANDTQCEEWVRLFAIDEIQPTLEHGGYSEPLTVELLKGNDKLILDTRFFDGAFKERLVESIDGFDEQCNGLTIHSENFQALQLMQDRYREQVNCIYIDPPYNTGGDGFLYRDSYRHSSWLSFIGELARSCASLCALESSLFSSIDENEFEYLLEVLKSNYSWAGTVVVQNNPKGRFMDRHLSTSHEYLLCYTVNANHVLHGIPKSDDQLRSQFPKKDDRGRYRLLELRNTHREFGKHNRPNLYYPLFCDLQTNSVSLERTVTHNMKVFPIWDDGFNGCWTWGTDLVEKQSDYLVGREIQGTLKVYRKAYAKDAAFEKPKTIWNEREVQTEVGQLIINNLFGYVAFRSPKPPRLIEKAILLSSENAEFTLDYFAGSGTTAHAVINLNREDGGTRKYILVEMGDYFNTVLKPRIQKVVYSKEWKNGKPTSRNTGISHMFKYIRLEQYEDTLNNISFTQKSLLDFEDYFLKYMLDFETRGSPSRLDIDQFKRPFEYKLWITNSDGEKEATNVDLVETFNYLLGIHVKRLMAFENNGTRYRVVHGCKEGESDSYTIIWRNCDDDLNLRADKEFIDGTILREFKAKKVYINGSSFVEGALPIEPEFKERMGG